MKKFLVIGIVSILLISGMLVGASNIENDEDKLSNISYKPYNLPFFSRIIQFFERLVEHFPILEEIIEILRFPKYQPTNVCNPVILLPEVAVTMVVYDGIDLVYGTGMSYFDTFLSDVPNGFDVVNGHYLGWCSQKWVFIDRGVPYSVMLYSSYDPSMPAPFQDNDWDKINYILNNKQGDWINIQDAIWYYLDFPPNNPSDPDYQAMILAADTFGNDFCPDPGDTIAILAYANEQTQRCFFEIEIPEYGGFTPGWWKNHLDDWPESYNSEDTLADAGFTIPGGIILDDYKNNKRDREVNQGHTLEDALNYLGGRGHAGCAQILLRAAVAALLNAASGNINYPKSEQWIISEVNAALATGNRNIIISLADSLDEWNNLG